MDSQKIEEQIKGLLGLNLGNGTSSSLPPSGGSPQLGIGTIPLQPDAHAPGSYPKQKEK